MVDLPEPVRALAARLGADGSFKRVRLKQSGSMSAGRGKPWMRFSATETIDLTTVMFDWRARIGPLSALTVVDRLSSDETRSELRFLGVVPLSRPPPDQDALRKGQTLRYLAEIAWAPDAILRNASLHWETKGALIRVSSPGHSRPWCVELELDEEGRIRRATADGRPCMEKGKFIERPWQGRFWDYRERQSRWIPFRGEVAWIIDGIPSKVWEGTITEWEACG
ncbi:DUF6544 family protein [Bradyrhizobium monzae]|uniref:DUF6544 family protein n=1 Tax=Bradyrhizobium sp. Oc8 TaxID=2876780 RepID=UPI001F25F2F0|nr:DUF6544 family protein [Bradyrhizobium sp. Oc8]